MQSRRFQHTAEAQPQHEMKKGEMAHNQMQHTGGHEEMQSGDHLEMTRKMREVQSATVMSISAKERLVWTRSAGC